MRPLFVALFWKPNYSSKKIDFSCKINDIKRLPLIIIDLAPMVCVLKNGEVFSFSLASMESNGLVYGV
jgi:hypothetical protein